MADALDQVSIGRAAVGVVFSWTRSDGKRCRLYASDARMATLTPDNQPYHPILVQHDDIIIAGDDKTFAFTLAVDSWFTVEVYSATYSYEQYTSLYAVLRQYPEALRAATATIYIEGENDSGTVKIEQILTATVEQTANTNAATMSFYCTLIDDVEEFDVPVRETGINAIASDDDEYDDTKGTAVPVSFGDFVQVTPWTFTAQTWLKYWLGVFGWEIPVAEALPVGRRKTRHSEIRCVYAERTTGGLDKAATAYGGIYMEVGGKLAKVYDQWFDQSGNAVIGQAARFIDRTEYFGVEVEDRPFVQLPVTPTAVEASTSTMKLSRAVDNNPGTYAVIPSGETVTFSLPTVSLPGRMSLNSTDAGTDASRDSEGANYPVGFKIICCLVNHGSASITGNVTLSLQFDDGFVYLQGTADACSLTTTPTLAPGEGRMLQLNIPYRTATPNQGWGGTRWQSGDFTAGQSNDTSDPDYPVWRVGCEGYPMRIAFTNSMSGPVGLAAIGPLLGVRVNTPVTVSTRDIPAPATKRQLRLWLRERDYFVSSPRNDDREFNYGAIGASPWGPDPVKMRREYERWLVANRETPISAIKVARGMYADDSSGTYTGTASKTLTQPIEASRAAIQIYGGASSALICSGSELGSYEVAREAVRRWYSGGVSSLDWTVLSQLLAKTPVGTVADGYLTNCLGMKRVRYPNGKYGWYHWGPVASLDSGRLYNGGTPIEAEQLVLMEGDPDSPESFPSIQIGHTGRASVINSIRIMYRGRLSSMASCNWEDSTDGDFEEANWPAIPYSFGLLPGGTGGLCDTSRLRFGQRRPVTIDFTETHDSRVAVGEGLHRLARGWQPEPQMDAECGLGLHDLWEGHVFRLSNAVETKFGIVPPFWGNGVEWEDLWWMCTQNAVLSKPHLPCRIHAVWLPYNLGPMGRGGAFGGDEEEILLSEGL